jgi:hypothetical protein
MAGVDSYSMVETLLAKVFGAGAEAQKGALRGRIKHLQRLGLTVKAPGVRKIAYTSGQIYELGFCLQLEQLGVDPTLAVKLLQAHRGYVLRAYRNAEEALQNGEDYFFWLVTEFMSARWSTKKLKFPGLPVFQAGRMQELEDAIARFDSRQGGCLALFRMTLLVREVLQAAKAQND